MVDVEDFESGISLPPFFQDNACVIRGPVIYADYFKVRISLGSQGGQSFFQGSGGIVAGQKDRNVRHDLLEILFRMQDLAGQLVELFDLVRGRFADLPVLV